MSSALPAVAGAATGGIGSLLTGGLFSFLPGLLSHLFGGDPQAHYRAMVAKLLTQRPDLINKYYQQAQGSPAFSQAQGQIAAGANATQGGLQSALGARGIGTSGTGAILSSLLPSIVGSQQSQLRTSAYGAAQNQADSDIQAQLAALQGSQGPSQTQQYFGAGLSSFGPLLEQWLKQRYAGTGGGGSWSTTGSRQGSLGYQ